MFGLYPAGQQWTRVFETQRTAREVQRDLTAFAGFTAGLFHQPFGPARGEVLAVRDDFLVLVNADRTQIAVSPDVAGQYLLWADHNNLQDQWSQRDVAAITGFAGWPEYLNGATSSFASISEAVQAAIDGELQSAPESAVPADSALAEPHLPNPDDAIWEANCASADANFSRSYSDYL